MNHEDHDWVFPDPAVDAAADTERPPAPRVWRCDDLGAEPTHHASLIEATCEPPRTPEAQVYGGGALLAQSAEDVSVWAFTEAGMRQIAREANGIVMRVAS